LNVNGGAEIKGKTVIKDGNLTTGTLTHKISDITSNIILDPQLVVSDNETGQSRLYLGSYYTSGIDNVGVIQSSDTYSGLDHSSKLLLNPRGGNVGVGTTNPQATLHINGTFYSPGCIVQTIGENVHDIVSYVSTTAATEITPLNIVITPKFVGSKIQLQWMINYEAYQDVVLSIYRKIGTGSVTKIGYNNTIADNIWNGVASSTYDQDTISTMATCYINWFDSPNTLEEVTYYVYYQSSYTGQALPFYLNRTAVSIDVGESRYERTVSSKLASEIAQ